MKLARLLSPLLLASTLLLALPAAAEKRGAPTPGNDDPMSAETFRGLTWRNLGPALMSGRIADIVLHPDDPSVRYVAVGSGGVWKTVNAGTTWEPIFDDQGSYSIGALGLDPSNPATLWVGTGENVGGRHVGYGDGIYVTHDGGASWQRRGLETSEHLSTIVVHPEDSDTVWVAAQGPLWSPGGERGLYRTTDGGETWTRTLGDDEWTGVTDVLIDPRNPDRIYAATWQRHRTVAAYMGGGPLSGIHRSEDGGVTWTELTEGLPEGNMGKIGLAMSSGNPDVIYAAIETDRREGGLWASTDRGATWEKRSDAVGGGTGPHYYQELYANPHHQGWLYLMSNTTQVSKDGGHTFEPLNNENKHVDDHAVAFHPTDRDYIMIGSDGGLYESFDHTETWRFVDNLPITQFYKVAVDDDEPFYNVYGGTQDNNSQGGPSRTDNVHGIRNSDWFVTLGGDGHQSATEPGNPDIVYAEWQQGNLARFDRTTGEVVYIKPQGEPGDPPERFNWDAPILVSPHQPTRLYFASQRVWRSDDRGDSWTPISGDLTRDEDRVLQPILGRQQSWDSPWDMYAMSQFHTITSLAESPLVEGLLYVGTDDGLLRVREGADAEWRRIEAAALPGVPERAFVNDVKADLHDADTVYVALDNHKEGDYRPFLLKSADRGRTWTSIAADLPERHLVWRLVQDHEKADLMFAATEFGVFFTPDGGERWIELEGGMPTIAVRDLAIQRRENDLVAATFGRGFYVLDDYSLLRSVDDELLDREAALFGSRPADWYIERGVLGTNRNASQGDSFYTADNPPFGAVLGYWLRDTIQTREQKRREAEKPKLEAGEDTPFPGWEAVEAERREQDPAVVLTVRDAATGAVVRRLRGPATAGLHRVAWDLRFPAHQAIGVEGSYFSPEVRGPLAGPGTYTVDMATVVDGTTTAVGEPVEIEVERITEGALPGAPVEEVVAFWSRVADVERATTALAQALPRLEERIAQLREAVARTRSAPDGLDLQMEAASDRFEDLKRRLQGTEGANTIGHLEAPTLSDRLFVANYGTSFSTYGPTPTHVRQIELAEQELEEVRESFGELVDVAIPALEREILAAGGPWVPGMPLP